MEISLTPELQRLVEVKVAQGLYRTDEEVLRAAMQALDAQEQTLAAIAEGYSDFRAGRYRSFEEVDAEFRQRHGLPHDQ